VLLIDRNFIGPRREWDLLNELERLRIEHVNGMLPLIRTVVIQSVGVGRQIVRIRTASDETHNLIGGRIDHMLNSSSIVTLQDPYGDTVVRVKPGHTLGRSRPNQQKVTNHYQQRTADE
jgi:hypothetical protein